MARLKPDPIGRDDLLEYLGGYSDFSFELSVLKQLRLAGLECEHGGLYDDPVTSKPREFDIRATRTNGIRRVRMAVECKNIREHFPVLISCVPRHASECFHEVAMVSEPRTDVMMRGAGVFTSRAKVLRLESEYSLYRHGAPVGKSTAQVGRLLDGSISSNDSEIHEKWGQCLSSSQELADRVYWDGTGESGNPLYLCAVLPFVVVPDGRLWTVEYDGDGNRTSDPMATDRVSCYVGKAYSIGTKVASSIFTVSHVEVATVAGLTDFVRSHLSDEGELQTLFPKEGLKAAYEKLTG